MPDLNPLATLDSGPVLFYTRAGRTVELEGLYDGCACFIVLSAPSLADANLELLRGVMTLGVNNSWSIFRPRLWTCADPPGKFCAEGWADPSIMKLVPMQYAKAAIRYRNQWGEIIPSARTARDMPGTLFFQRNTTFEPADFLCQSSVNCGHTQQPEREGKPKDERQTCRSVMIQALRLATVLGFRTIYLVGCDFQMNEAKPYAFDENKDDRSRRWNNTAYRRMSQMYADLVPYFDLHGIRVFNTTKGSKLTVFPHVGLGEAVRDATQHCGPMRTDGYYGGEPDDVQRKYRCVAGAD